MQFGINTFVWVSPLTTAAVAELAPKAKAFGFDVLELAVEGTELVDVPAVRAELERAGLGTVVCGAFGPNRNLCSPDATIRATAAEYIRWLIDAAAALGSSVVAGPMYSAVGKARLADAEDRRAEHDLAVAGVAEAADYARARGVRLALEMLNRFETDMLNIAEQGLAFIAETGRDNVGLHLDTFHMHLEEKSSAAAIRLAGDRLFHFHACENDRGTPGSGQVRWDEIAQALRDVRYAGPVVIESFTPDVQEIARAVCIWRQIAPSQDALAADGLRFLRGLLA